MRKVRRNQPRETSTLNKLIRYIKQYLHLPYCLLICLWLTNTFFQDAKINEVDSGTELDSQGEDETEEAADKDSTEKKED